MPMQPAPPVTKTGACMSESPSIGHVFIEQPRQVDVFQDPADPLGAIAVSIGIDTGLQLRPICSVMQRTVDCLTDDLPIKLRHGNHITGPHATGLAASDIQ